MSSGLCVPQLLILFSFIYYHFSFSFGTQQWYMYWITGRSLVFPVRKAQHTTPRPIIGIEGPFVFYTFCIFFYFIAFCLNLDMYCVHRVHTSRSTGITLSGTRYGQWRVENDAELVPRAASASPAVK